MYYYYNVDNDDALDNDDKRKVMRLMMDLV